MNSLSLVTLFLLAAMATASPAHHDSNSHTGDGWSTSYSFSSDDGDNEEGQVAGQGGHHGDFNSHTGNGFSSSFSFGGDEEKAKEMLGEIQKQVESMTNTYLQMGKEMAQMGMGQWFNFGNQQKGKQ